MLSFKSPTFTRFTERLSFKKLREPSNDEDFASFDSIYNDWERTYEHFGTRKSPLGSPNLSFSDYNGGAKLSRKNRRHPSVEEDQSYCQYQCHYNDIEYNPDGTVNTRATQANLQARSADAKRRLSILVVIDDTLDKIKYTLSSPDKCEPKKKLRYSNGSKINAEVKIQFDDEKCIYRV